MMKNKDYIIYHNPKCSKSREALKILEEHEIKPHIIEYLNAPLTKPELHDMLIKLDQPYEKVLRTKDELFKELNINLNNEDEVIDTIIENPSLLERPIVVTNTRAIIGRPPEAILELI